MFSKSEWKEDIYCVSGLKKCSSFVKKKYPVHAQKLFRDRSLITPRGRVVGGGGGGGYNFQSGAILGGQF